MFTRITVRLVSPLWNKWRPGRLGSQTLVDFSCLVCFGDFVSYYTMKIWFRVVRLLSLFSKVAKRIHTISALHFSRGQEEALHIVKKISGSPNNIPTLGTQKHLQNIFSLQSFISRTIFPWLQMLFNPILVGIFWTR